MDDKIQYKIKTQFDVGQHALLLPTPTLAQGYLLLDRLLWHMHYTKQTKSSKVGGHVMMQTQSNQKNNLRFLGPSCSSKTVLL